VLPYSQNSRVRPADREFSEKTGWGSESGDGGVFGAEESGESQAVSFPAFGAAWGL